MIAATNGSVEIIRLLLDKGADTSLKDKSGKTPLQWARTNNRIRAVEILSAAR